MLRSESGGYAWGEITNSAGEVVGMSVVPSDEIYLHACASKDCVCRPTVAPLPGDDGVLGYLITHKQRSFVVEAASRDEAAAMVKAQRERLHGGGVEVLDVSEVSGD